MAVTIRFAVFLISCGAVLGQAQQVSSQPGQAEQREMLSRLSDNITKLQRTTPQFSCEQPAMRNSELVQGAPRPRNSVVVDLVPPPYGRTPQTGVGASVPVDQMMADLFSSAPQFSFAFVATLQGRRTAVFRYSDHADGATRAASIYADPQTGAVYRILFSGFDVPGHFASYHCTEERR
jgi:hypothetical protein